MNEEGKILKITDELEKQEEFWMDKTDDSYGINLSVAMSINAIRQAILAAVVESKDISQ